MDDKDNGEFITASSIVAVSVNAKVRQTLTQNVEMIALYPAASVDANQIAFCTEKGQLYLMNININKDSLDESNLDNLIENTNQIILYNIFSKMDITIEQIDYNCQILEIIKEFNEEN